MESWKDHKDNHKELARLMLSLGIDIDNFINFLTSIKEDRSLKIDKDRDFRDLGYINIMKGLLDVELFNSALINGKTMLSEEETNPENNVVDSDKDDPDSKNSNSV